MTVKFLPAKLSGTTDAPPSKSMAHRMLICAGLSQEKSVIRKIAPSQDMLATMDCLRALGAKINYDGISAEVEGISQSANKAVLNCRECGSTLRFFVPIALLFGNETVFTGSDRLFMRPMSIYEEICRKQNILYELEKNTLKVCGRLKSGKYEVAGNVSSQFISGLLFVLPLLAEDSEIKITPPVESRPYIEMTLKALSVFGADAAFKDNETICIKGGQTYSGREIAVEGDYSNAAFFDAFNLTGGNVTVRGLDKDSLQGDKIYKKLFEKLKGGTPTIDLSDCPDLGPVCMALAAALGGAKFIGTKRLKIKESDRCGAMAEELSKFGIESAVKENSMTIFKSELKRPSEVLSGHNDHRIVMALSVLCCITGGSIEGAEAVNKSLPDFFDRIKTLGAQTEY